MTLVNYRMSDTPKHVYCTLSERNVPKCLNIFDAEALLLAKVIPLIASVSSPTTFSATVRRTGSQSGVFASLITMIERRPYCLRSSISVVNVSGEGLYSTNSSEYEWGGITLLCDGRFRSTEGSEVKSGWTIFESSIWVTTATTIHIIDAGRE